MFDLCKAPHLLLAYDNPRAQHREIQQLDFQIMPVPKAVAKDNASAVICMYMNVFHAIVSRDLREALQRLAQFHKTCHKNAADCVSVADLTQGIALVC
jgi:hypothetical protein